MYIYTNITQDFILIHLSDEYLSEDSNRDLYKSHHCKHVFRNYILENEETNIHDNITYIPLGYKQGMFDKITTNDCRENDVRKYTWSFVGDANKNISFKHNKENYYEFLFDEKHPIPTISCTDDLSTKVLDIMKNKYEIRDMIISWYESYKVKLKEKIQTTIHYL